MKFLIAIAAAILAASLLTGRLFEVAVPVAIAFMVAAGLASWLKPRS